MHDVVEPGDHEPDRREQPRHTLLPASARRIARRGLDASAV